MLTEIKKEMLGYNIKNLKIVDTNDGYCFNCKIYKNEQLIAIAENGGTGWATNINYANKQVENDFKMHC